jgi:predicted RNA binding protein YcfA (HicA-like mRNA interferase family)
MSRELPALKPAKVLRALQRAGFFIHHIVPYHSGDLKRRTLLSIVEQSGYSIEEFLDLV